MGGFDFLQTRPAVIPSSVPAPDQRRTLELFKHDTCGCCVRVMRAVDRLGVQVTCRDVRADLEHRHALRRLTGRARVPSLLVDGQPLLESADIVAWLEAYAARAA